MSLEVNYGWKGDGIKAYCPIIGSWGAHGNSFGIQKSSQLDFRGGYKIKVQFSLRAWNHGSYSAPREFPSDVKCGFDHSPQLGATVSNGKIDFFVQFMENLPWRLTEKGQELEIFWSDDKHSSIEKIGFTFTIWVIFKQTDVRPSPLSFEWGNPRQVAGHFESNRRRH